MLHLRIRRTSGIAIIGLSMLMVLAMAAPVAAKKNPPGNNGTVKIDRAEFDDHPNNEPAARGCPAGGGGRGPDRGRRTGRPSALTDLPRHP
jgi:hypothetical protein